MYIIVYSYLDLAAELYIVYRAHNLHGPTAYPLQPPMFFLPGDQFGCVFILVIPSSLVISSPNVSYYLYMYVLCIFRSNIAQHFSEENPFWVASGA